jgi:predicted nucleic acid-binding protein
MTSVAVDTGPIVALLNARDRHHAWAKTTFSQLEPPLSTCEAVLTESCHLLRNVHGGSSAVLTLLRSGVVEIRFDLSSEVGAVQALMKRYESLPMSLADASLVRMHELDNHLRILTLDNDFRIYRRNGRQPLKLVIPDRPN